MSDEHASETARRAYDKATEAHVLASLTDQRVTSHEAQCAERYQGIIENLKQLRGIIMAAGGALIVLLLGVVGTLFMAWQGSGV